MPPMEPTANHSKHTDSPTLCPCCDRTFLLALEVIDVSEQGRWLLAMRCVNCAWEGSRELDDFGVEALDLQAQLDRDHIEDAADDLAFAAQQGEVMAFALALREDRILPEDF